MIPVRSLFEKHLTVRDLPLPWRSTAGVLKLERALFFEPPDFAGNPTHEPVVIAWLPDCSSANDDNMLEFLSILPDPPQPDLGVVAWSRWVTGRRHQE
jgi:hypothetical protein